MFPTHRRVPEDTQIHGDMRVEVSPASEVCKSQPWVLCSSFIPRHLEVLSPGPVLPVMGSREEAGERDARRGATGIRAFWGRIRGDMAPLPLSRDRTCVRCERHARSHSC